MRGTPPKPNTIGGKKDENTNRNASFPVPADGPGDGARAHD